MRLEMDSGPIVAQAAVPVFSSDTGDELAARVLAAEHKLYPAALALVASGRARVEDEKIVISEDFNHGARAVLANGLKSEYLKLANTRTGRAIWPGARGRMDMRSGKSVLSPSPSPVG